MSLSEKNNIYYISVSLISFLFSLYVFSSGKFIFLILPVAFAFLTVIVFAPGIIPYLLIYSNFYGGFIFVKDRIAITISDVFFVVFVCAYISQFIVYGVNKKINGSNILTPLTLLFIVSIISFFVNLSVLENKYLIISIWYMLKFVQIIVAFFIALQWLQNDVQREKIINVVLFLSLLQLPVALYQYFSFKTESYLRFYSRIHGTLTYHHSMLGTFLLIPFAFCMARLFDSKTRFDRIKYVIIAFCLLSVIILSGSRSVLLGLIVSVVVFLLMHFKIKKQFFGYSFLFFLFLTTLFYLTPLKTVLISTFHSDSTHSLDLSSISRLIIWHGAITNFIQENWIQKLFGVGIGAYPSIKYDILLWGRSKIVHAAHNNYLHVLSELGMVGVVVFLALFYTILKALYNHYAYCSYCKMYFFITIALLVSGITQETFWFEKSFGCLWMFYLIFLAIFLQRNNPNEKRAESYAE